MFSANFVFCPGFLTFWDKFQAISGPGQIKSQTPSFQVLLGTLSKDLTSIVYPNVSISFIQTYLYQFYSNLPSSGFHSNLPLSFIQTYLYQFHSNLPSSRFHSNLPVSFKPTSISFIQTYLYQFHSNLPSSRFHSNLPVSFKPTCFIQTYLFHSNLPLCFIQTYLHQFHSNLHRSVTFKPTSIKVSFKSCFFSIN